jgi:hypothetical protein
MSICFAKLPLLAPAVLKILAFSLIKNDISTIMFILYFPDASS